MELVRDYAQNFKQLNVLTPYLKGHNGYIGGGCFKNIFRNEPIKDIDIFFNTTEDFIDADNYFSKHSDYELVYANKNAISYLNVKTNMRIELIRSLFGKPEDVIKKFDFSICKFLLIKGDDFLSTDKVIYVKSFFQDLATSSLVIDGEIRTPYSTFERVIRFTNYGFKIDKDSRLALLESIKRCEYSVDLSEDNY